MKRCHLGEVLQHRRLRIGRLLAGLLRLGVFVKQLDSLAIRLYRQPGHWQEDLLLEMQWLVEMVYYIAWKIL